MCMKLYLAVTCDDMELPLYVTESLDELCNKFGVSKNVVLSSIAHHHSGKRRGVKFARIEVNWREESDV